MMLRSRSNVFQSPVPALRWQSRAVPKLPYRPFMKDSQLLIASQPILRPQLPFLHANRHNVLQTQKNRLLSTERRKYYTTQVLWFLRICGIAAIGIGCWQVADFGFRQAGLEQIFLSPAEWSYFTRVWFRLAKDAETPRSEATGYSPQSMGKYFLWALQRLENPSKDGAGIKSTMGEGEEIYVEGLGKMGADITTKSEQWRRGYHDVLMGAAKAAEQLDEWVWDQKQKTAVPRDTVVGPSNPQPVPVEEHWLQPPMEEDCQERAYEPPEVYYMKILTTQGFTSRQKLDAALAYADWLEFSGLRSSAEDMYAWALDIATANLSIDQMPIDKKTAIINPKATNVTDNILLAATAIATHHARASNLAAALPIFLSVLRAQQSLPPANPSIFIHKGPQVDTSNITGIVRALFTPPDYGPEPPSGDEPATHTPANICAEAGTMAHIGEILFASSSSLPTSRSVQSSSEPDVSESIGLSWTRDAVDLAETTFRNLPGHGTKAKPPFMGDPGLGRGVAAFLARGLKASPAEEEAKERCAECLLETTKMWRRMLRILDNREAAAAQENRGSGATKIGWPGWFWGVLIGDRREGEGSVEKTGEQRKMGTWMAEEMRVSEREASIRRMLRQEGMTA